MGLGRLVEAWNNYGIQMLVLMSLVLQLLLFILPILRRHKMLEKWVYPARLCKLLLWLAYQLADTTAIYVLGHMAISSSSSLSGEVMALWASLLLVHLGGQDTMTAYSLEDNRLWKRHLLTLLVQTAGVVYALHGLGGAGGGRSSGPYPRLRGASAWMFVAGLLKFTERIWVLWASDMNKLFTSQDEDRRQKYFTAPHGQDSSERAEEDLRQAHGQGKDSSERAEEDLKQAHELLHFCICQFVDYKKGLTEYQKGVIKYYAREKRLCELVHLQLSLMHDLLYTKAAAIHTRCGFLLRVFSWLATATTCTLVFLSGSSYGGRQLDVGVTYTLLAGAFLLETASSLKAVGSTWTYEILCSGGWCGLGRVVLAFRRLVRAAEQSRPRCPIYIGGLETSTLCGVHTWWSAFGQIILDTSPVVDVIEEMVTEYIKMDKKEKLMNSRGGLSLDRLLLSSSDQVKVTLTQELEQLEFDEYFLLWHHATSEFSSQIPVDHADWHRMFGQLCCYMMYLFKKQPHMLPSPVRTISYTFRENRTSSVCEKLLKELLAGTTQDRERKLKPLIWVWVEMLCYAASHCNRESHARELSNGSPKFATVLWIVRAALINAHMEPAVSTVAAASVRDKSPVATEGNNVILPMIHPPSFGRSTPNR